jgi:predicted metalloenzyme YecM
MLAVEVLEAIDMFRHLELEELVAVEMVKPTETKERMEQPTLAVAAVEAMVHTA